MPYIIFETKFNKVFLIVFCYSKNIRLPIFALKTIINLYCIKVNNTVFIYSIIRRYTNSLFCCYNLFCKLKHDHFQTHSQICTTFFTCMSKAVGHFFTMSSYQILATRRTYTTARCPSRNIIYIYHSTIFIFRP